MLKNFGKILASLFFILLTSACADDLDLGFQTPSEGEGNLHATVNFYPVVANTVGRSTPGDAIEDINDLSIIIYDQYKNLYRIYNSADGDFPFTTTTHKDTPTMSPEDMANGGEWSSQPQASASFTLKDIPFGTYYIYAVANMGPITTQQASSIEDLQNITLSWDPERVASNNQMFGYFTNSSEASTDTPVAGFGPVAVRFNKNTSITAWIKRASSKVTVSYDGSGLYQDVYVYIRKVTIKDIPASCLLGADNKPAASGAGQPSPLIADGESVFYNTRGIATDDKDPGSDWENSWLRITNATKSNDSFHSYSAPSLFFYENMQGDYENSPDKDKYCKQPDFDDVEDFLEELGKNPNASPADFDTKDQVPMGSYIEVEGYYLSQNKNNIGSGPIKYRFMLGKNTTYNFNAQRNHHYKVTLKFHGWANQPEWHIDYVEENPGLYTPDRFYMPYLYNQKADFPVKLNGKCKSLKMEIVENAWGPRLPDDPSNAPAGTVKATGAVQPGMTLDYYDFVWNRYVWETFNNGYNGKRWPSLGYLALTKPSNIPPANILMDVSFSDKEAGYNQLKAYYEGRGGSAQSKNNLPQNVRVFSDFSHTGMLNTSDNNLTINQYEVLRSDDNGSDLLIPLFTRPKSMIHGTDFSGNNPYGYYIRYAKLRITAVFSTGHGDETVEKYVDVYQVPRITNPKAVWRKSGSSEDFNVLLTTRSGGPSNSDYIGFISDGSWSATVDQIGGYDNFSIAGNGGEYVSTSPTEIVGRTGSQVKFKIKFGGAANACGIVTVRYHGGTCVHRIFLRQGYEPMQITSGGATWCSFNVYSSTGAFNTSGNNVVNATLVQSPLSIGSLFKKGNYQQGILIRNNNTWGPLVSGSYNFALSNGKTSGWGSDNSANSNNANIRCTDGISYLRSQYYYSDASLVSRQRNWPWAKFKAGGRTYRVPTYAEFKDITDNCDFGFGIMYGDGATETQTTFTDAEGYMDQNGSTTSSSLGVRGVLVYNARDARQIFFSMGKFGQGRRTMFNLQGLTAGALRYGDVTNPLDPTETNKNNNYRPIPYNLGHQPGSLYWIRGIKYDHVHNENDVAVGAWDINYFSFNFSEYTNNNYRDALPIKLVVD